MPVRIGDKCKRGHSIEGDNVQHYTNQGKPHVRCKACNQPPKNPPKKRGDLCKQGHTIDGPNYGERVIFGKMQAFCRQCAKEAVRRYQEKKSGQGAIAKPTNKDKNEKQAQRRAAERADEMIVAGKEENALNYLRLTKRAERASIALHKKMVSTEPNCIDSPEQWIDYDEDNPPSKLQAFLMCQDCPVLVECARFATAYKPAVGVWGGEVYKDGKPIN
jgi:hypothetical protein